MDASAYAFTHGVRRTRETFDSWRERPAPVLRRWVLGSLAASTVLLVAIWAVASGSQGHSNATLARPPFAVGGPRDVLGILGKNLLVLAAWVSASRRGEWEQLLAAAAVTVAIAVPMLVATALWEVYVAPHLLSAMFGYAG